MISSRAGTVNHQANSSPFKRKAGRKQGQGKRRKSESPTAGSGKGSAGSGEGSQIKLGTLNDESASSYMKMLFSPTGKTIDQNNRNDASPDNAVATLRRASLDSMLQKWGGSNNEQAQAAKKPMGSTLSNDLVDVHINMQSETIFEHELLQLRQLSPDVKTGPQELTVHLNTKEKTEDDAKSHSVETKLDQTVRMGAQEIEGSNSGSPRSLDLEREKNVMAIMHTIEQK